MKSFCLNRADTRVQEKVTAVVLAVPLGAAIATLLCSEQKSSHKVRWKEGIAFNASIRGARNTLTKPSINWLSKRISHLFLYREDNTLDFKNLYSGGMGYGLLGKSLIFYFFSIVGRRHIKIIISQNFPLPPPKTYQGLPYAVWAYSAWEGA
jgi:hypothetical protein